MRRDLINKSGGLAGTSEFTVMARIKPGLIPALDAVTYKTRAKRVLRALHLGRSSGFEYELARILSDSVERVGRIHSVSIRVIEPQDVVTLAVTFDGAWEAYVRVIWQKVTRLLDLIFCNTEDYVLGWENSYQDWGAWLRRSQTETSFLYATPALTVDDTRYLGMLERLHRRDITPERDLDVTQIHIPSAEEIAEMGIFGAGDTVGVDPTDCGYSQPLMFQDAARPPFRHGMSSLAGLYRLADLYPPGTPDGAVLQRAAAELLPEFLRMVNDGSYQTGVDRGLKRFDEALNWFRLGVALPDVRQPPPQPDEPRPDQPANVQGGILSPYEQATNGCLLLVGFDSQSALAGFLARLKVTPADAAPAPGEIATNIAFTAQGLRRAGLSEDEVRAFPDEFVQGMESRNGLLGDLRVNHPRRWRLPMLNWHLGIAAPDATGDDPGPRVSLDAVHVVLQFRLQPADGAPAAPRQVLMDAMTALVDAQPGVVPLSLQWMQRLQDSTGNVIEHFGFQDGKTQPVFDKSEAGRRYPNRIRLGEVLCGYPNEVDLPQRREGQAGEVDDLMKDGSFLVIRKLRQDVEQFDGAIQAAVAQPQGPALSREDLMAKMLGRWPSGHPQAGDPLAVIVPGDGPNDFNYQNDGQGALCPFHAHIRRANPRLPPEPLTRPPRIMRRGMSYGPKHDRGETDPDKLKDSLAQERGMVFMVYNTSISEQFEVVQRWLAGGNSSESYSGQSDPLLGLAEPGRRRFLRFEQDGQTCRVALDGSDALHDEPRPFVRLEWGAYLFAPSRSTLAALQARAVAQKGPPPVAWDPAAGELEIARLRAIEVRDGDAAAALAWKTSLEDPEAGVNFLTASVWAAIRSRHEGVLRTPYGILVGSRQRVDETLTDAPRQLSANGYLARMRRSFGGIFLGLDAGEEDGAYERESLACNQAIMSLDPEQAFLAARARTTEALDALAKEAIAEAIEDLAPRWDLTIDVRELIDPMLEAFCETWFGLSTDGGLFRRGGFRWDWAPGDPPCYPGHFMAPSRYIFQAHPSAEVESMGGAHGQALRQAMRQFLQNFGPQISAPVSRAVLDSEAGLHDPAFCARSIVGAIMGFVPTIDGNLRAILNEWLREGTLSALRARFGGSPSPTLAEARVRLGPDFSAAMQLRAVPPMIWRTAAVSHAIGPAGPHQVAVEPGEIIVLGLASATQQSLEQPPDPAAYANGEPGPGLCPAFGGDRWAPTPRPTHACPGSHAAMGVMLGFFSALVESPLTLRTGPGPLTLYMDGKVPAAVPGHPGFEVVTRLFEAQARAADMLPPPAPKAKGAGCPHARLADAGLGIEGPGTAARVAAATLVTPFGDSWLSRLFPSANLVSALKQKGFAMSGGYGLPGALLQSLAAPGSSGYLQSLVSDLANLIPGPGCPRALLIGGGGNDLHRADQVSESRLYGMLLQAPAPGVDPLIAAKVDAFVDGELFGYYRTIVDAIVGATSHLPSIPILVHAYDHPTPDDRGIFFPHSGPWLHPIFAARGIDAATARDVMKRLIDRLDAMVGQLALAYPGRVHHVSLCGILEADPRYAQDYQLLWSNELHATPDGFGLLADVIVKKLKALNIP